MDIPIVPRRHTDIAAALVAQCLEVMDHGTPTDALVPRLDELAETGEIIELVAALAFLGASLASAASGAAMELASHTNMDTTDLTPEGLLARIAGVSEGL